MLAFQLLVNGLITGCLVGIVAASFALIYASTNVFHIAHAGILLLGAYCLLAMTDYWGVPLVVALPATVAFAALAGMAIQWFIYRRLLLRGASPLVIMIASLGLLAMIDNGLAMAFTADTLFYADTWGKEVVHIGGLIVTRTQILSVVVALALVAGLQALLSFTALGRQIRAVTANPLMAEIGRLRPQRIYLLIYAIGSAVVAIGGILIASDFGLRPYTGITYLLTASIAMIAAGIGRIFGAFFVAVAVGAIQNIALLYMPSQYSFPLAFVVFVILIILRPRGIFGSKF